MPQGGNAMPVPFDQRPDLIWLDGKLIPTADCKISVLTHGLHYASAVFEGERAYGGEIFKSIEHSERLKRSAQLMDFEIPFTVAEIEAAKQLVLDRNNQKEAYVRAIAWRGSEQLGVSAQNNTIHLAVATWEWPSYFDPAQRLKGIKLDLAEYRRPDPKTAPALAKASCLYAICTISKHRAERRGFADALMLDWQGRVAECTGANIFFVKGRQNPHADRRLLPCRHHPRHRDVAGAAAQHRGDRAPHHAGGTRRLFRVLHHRHRRRGDRRVADRRLYVHSRPHHSAIDERLHRRSSAQGQGRSGVRAVLKRSSPLAWRLFTAAGSR
jgi:branched-subunit amino acid aminotransferase/4-amino-4-deoxychorismate lyase